MDDVLVVRHWRRSRSAICSANKDIVVHGTEVARKLDELEKKVYWYWHFLRMGDKEGEEFV